MAFGARPGQVVTTMVRDSAIPIAGPLLGLGGTALATRGIESFLFETAPTDAATFAAVALALVAVGCLAALVPAMRAARVDPSRRCAPSRRRRADAGEPRGTTGAPRHRLAGRTGRQPGATVRVPPRGPVSRRSRPRGRALTRRPRAGRRRTRRGRARGPRTTRRRRRRSAAARRRPDSRSAIVITAPSAARGWAFGHRLGEEGDDGQGIAAGPDRRVPPAFPRLYAHVGV